jgi:hypothetical protein
MGTLTNISINLNKVDKSRLTKDKNGNSWLNLSGFVNEIPDDYGNNGFITQSQSKEERESGEKLPILGNFKLPMANTTKVQTEINPKANVVATKAPQPMPSAWVNEDADDDLPF